MEWFEHVVELMCLLETYTNTYIFLYIAKLLPEISHFGQ